MKMPLLLLVSAIAVSSLLFRSAEAQMTPGHLTHRIAPQPAPPPNNAPGVPGPVVAPPVQPAVRTGQPSPDLEKANEEFRKKRAQQGSDSAEAQPQPKAPTNAVPLVVEWKQVEPNPEQSLQSIDLSLTNTTQKAISRVTMRLIYFAATGERLKEWTTRRELDPPLPGKSTIELNQPAYFMPLVTKRVKVELEAVRFADGTEWAPPSAS